MLNFFFLTTFLNFPCKKGLVLILCSVEIPYLFHFKFSPFPPTISASEVLCTAAMCVLWQYCQLDCIPKMMCCNVSSEGYIT